MKIRNIIIAITTCLALSGFGQNESLGDLNIISNHDWSNNELGEYSYSEWQVDYPLGHTDRNLHRGDIMVDDTFGHVMRIDYNQYSFGYLGLEDPATPNDVYAFKFYSDIADPQDEVYMSYWIKIEDILLHGKTCYLGKLPFLAGGVQDGSPIPDGTNNFHAGIVYRQTTLPEFGLSSYLYLPTYKGPGYDDPISHALWNILWGYGNYEETSPYIYAGITTPYTNNDVPWVWEGRGNKYINVTQRVVLNEPPDSNGIIEGFVDGDLIYQIDGIKFRTTTDLKIDNFGVYFHTGGRDSCYYVQEKTYAYLGPVTVYYIEPGVADIPYGNELSSTDRKVITDFTGGDPGPSYCTPVYNTFGTDSNLVTNIKINFVPSTDDVPLTGDYTQWNNLNAELPEPNQTSLYNVDESSSGLTFDRNQEVSSHWNGDTAKLYGSLDSLKGQWRADGGNIEYFDLLGLTIGRSYRLTVWGSYKSDYGNSSYTFNGETKTITTLNNQYDTASWVFTADSTAKVFTFGDVVEDFDFLGTMTIVGYAASAFSDSLHINDTIDNDRYYEKCGLSVNNDSIYNTSSGYFASYWVDPIDSFNIAIIDWDKEASQTIGFIADSSTGASLGSRQFVIGSSSTDSVQLTTVNDDRKIFVTFGGAATVNRIRFAYGTVSTTAVPSDTIALSDTLWATQMDSTYHYEYDNMLQIIGYDTTIGYLDNTTYCGHTVVDFGTNEDSIHIKYIAHPDFLGPFEVWMDGLAGTKIADYTTVSTGGWSTFGTLDIALDQSVTGVHSIFIKSGVDGGGNILYVAAGALGPDCSNSITIVRPVWDTAFICNTEDIPGNLTYQWKLDGFNVGTNSNLYGLSGNGNVQCVVTSDECPSPFESNIIPKITLYRIRSTFYYGNINVVSP